MIEGVIVKVLPPESGTGQNNKQWEKQTFAVETQGKYKDLVAFDLWNENVSKCNLIEGDFVKVHFNIKSREWNGKYYTNLTAWKIETDQDSQNMRNAYAGNANMSKDLDNKLNYNEDLPF